MRKTPQQVVASRQCLLDEGFWLMLVSRLIFAEEMNLWMPALAVGGKE